MDSKFSFKVAILGCQRTGTTLIKEIFNAGQIFMMEENWSWAYLNRERWHACGVWQDANIPSYEQTVWKQSVKAFTQVAYEQYFAEKKSECHQYWGVKAPGLNMAKTAQYLESLFPELRFVIVVRDPRDVFASMKSSSKMAYYLPADFYASTINSPDLVDIYRDPYGYWGKVYSELERFQSQSGSKCRIIKYEEMLRAPLETITQVCDFLGIEFSDTMLEPFAKNISNASVISMSYSDYLAKNFVVTQSASGRWKKDLLPEEVENLSFASGEIAARMGYDLGNARIKSGRYESLEVTLQKRIDQLSAEKNVLEAREKWHLDTIYAFFKDGVGKVESHHIKTFDGVGPYGWVCKMNDLADIADTMDDLARSFLLLFEDEKLLYPPHSTHEEIFRLGGGRYSHWNDGLVFSTSDNSDPNKNGRSYKVVYRESPTMFAAREDELKKVAAAREDELKKVAAAREKELQGYLKSYALFGEKALKRTQIKEPYQQEIGLCWFVQLEDFLPIADNAEYPYRSTLLLYEDNKLLQPAHANHEDIRNLGRGCYSHWNEAFYFSTSDGSDPNSNGRDYRIVYIEYVSNELKESPFRRFCREVLAALANLRNGFD